MHEYTQYAVCQCWTPQVKSTILLIASLRYIKGLLAYIQLKYLGLLLQRCASCALDK